MNDGFSAAIRLWPKGAIDPEKTFAALISQPRSRRSDPHTGTRWRPRIRRHTSAVGTHGDEGAYPTGHLNVDDSKLSSRMQRLVSGRRTGRCPRLQFQVRKDLLDHRLLKNRRNDLQLTGRSTR